MAAPPRAAQAHVQQVIKDGEPHLATAWENYKACLMPRHEVEAMSGPAWPITEAGWAYRDMSITRGTVTRLMPLSKHSILKVFRVDAVAPDPAVLYFANILAVPLFFALILGGVLHFGPGHSADRFRSVYFFSIGRAGVARYDANEQFNRWWFASVFGTSLSLARVLADVGPDTVTPLGVFLFWTDETEKKWKKVCKRRRSGSPKQLEEAVLALGAAIEEAKKE